MTSHRDGRKEYAEDQQDDTEDQQDYTGEQQEQFKQAFAVKRRRQIFLAVALVPILVLLLGGSSRHGEQPVFHLPAAVAYFAFIAIVGGLVFSIKNWRCPACGKYLGKSIGLCECPRCGIALRSPAFSGSRPQVEYTEQQKEQFKQEFAAKDRRQFVTFISIVSIVLLMLLTAGHLPWFVPVSGLAIVMGAFVFSFVNWRCPACGKYLGQIPVRRHCPRCGVALR